MQATVPSPGGTDNHGCAANGGGGAPVNYFTGENLFSSTDLVATGLGGSSHIRHFATDASYVEGAMGPGWNDQMPRIIDKGSNRYALVDRSRHSRSFTKSGTTFTPDFLYKETLLQSPDGTGLDLLDEDGNPSIFYNTNYSNGNNPTGLGGRLYAGYDSFVVDGATNYTYTYTSYMPEIPPQYRSQLQTRSQYEVIGGVFDTSNYTHWTYTHPFAGTFGDRLQTVTLTRIVAGVWNTVRTTDYVYYQTSTGNGPAGTLQRATVKDAAGSTIETKYYRYDALDGNGRCPLRIVLEGRSYERAKAGLGSDALIDSATDLQLEPYIDYKFTYDANVSVTSEIVQGVGTISFVQTQSGFADAAANWKMKSVETLPDGNQNIVYTNYLAQDLLSIRKQGTNEWKTYKQYDAAGRLTEESTPTAVISYNDTIANLSVVRQASSGLISLTNYASTTTATTGTAGDVAGYVSSRQVKKGTSGTADTTEAYTYIRHDATVFAGPRSIFPLAARTVYEGVAGATPRTTTYTYTWQTPTGGAAASNRIASKTTAYPIVSTAKNGLGGSTATSDVQVYDKWGRPTWFKDADGFIHVTRYDRGTAAVTQRIVDVNTTTTTDEPAGWVTPAGGGLHLTTNYEFDLLARTKRVQDPLLNLTHTVYKDANWETRVYPGWTGTATTGPTKVSRRDKAGNYSEGFTMTAAPAYDAFNKPTGAEAVSGVVNISRDFYDDKQRLDHRDSYFNLSGLTYTTSTSYGTLATHFFRETCGYDSKGRKDRHVDPTGTISRTVFDARDRVSSTWIGTDDTPTSGAWSPSNLVGTNTFKMTEYIYDAGGVGNDTLTTSKFFTAAATSIDTVYAYDYRDRQTDSRSPQNVAVKRTLDNLGRATIVETYASADFTYTSAELRAKSETKFDEKLQVYQTVVHNVSPSTDTTPGQINNRLTTNFWSNARGMGVKTKGPNGEFQKTAYDGAGRVKGSFVSYEDAETTYAQAQDVASDTVIEQSVPTYDINSNVIQTTRYQRTNTTAKTGDLSSSWAETDSRRTYTAAWFDAVTRTTGVADYGRNGGTALSRPSSPPAPADAYIVTTFQYEVLGGRQYRTTDNKGRVTERTFNALNRVTKTVENYDNGTPTETELAIDRTTEWVYDGQGRLSELKAHNARGLGFGVEVQKTIYAYGTDANQTAPLVFRNDVLIGEILPDSDDTFNQAGSPGSKFGNGIDGTYDRVEYTYDYASRKLTWKLQDLLTIHTYNYDSVGRLLSDVATTLGNGIDGAIRRIQYGYETSDLGRVLTVGSYSATSGGTLRNEVRYSYDGWGQEKKCEQGHEGTATGAPSFQKTFVDGAVSGEAKYVRQSSVTYPNARIVYTNYPASGVGDKLSRPDNIANDASGTLKFAQMTYLGGGSVVKIAHPQVTGGLNLDYGTGTGNPGGWDDLGRIDDHKWQNDSSVIKDQYQYGYDRTSNRTFRDNLTAASLGKDHFYAYSGLDQVTSAKQGDLNAGRTDITGTPGFQEAWTLESIGNWRALTQMTAGATTLAQTRTHTKANEVTTIAATTGTNWGDGELDLNGFMTRVPKVTSLQNERWRLVSDAWLRLIRVVNDTGGATVAEYKYDGLHRRTVKLKFLTSTTWDRRDYYYSCAWQVVEERELLNQTSKTIVATVAKFQHLWGIRYIDEIVLRDENKDGDGDCIDGTDQRLYYAQDANFNVTALVDTANTVVERVLYDAYGKSTLWNAAWSATQVSTLYNNEVLYAGYRLDPESGMYKVRHRDYHPTLGRWVQRDPIGYHDGMNLYEYVKGNPALFTDALGQMTLAHSGMPKEDCPKSIPIPKNFMDAMNASWAKSGHGTAGPVEQGGSMIKTAAGPIEAREGKPGKPGSYPQENFPCPDSKKDEKYVGVWHTHPYPVATTVSAFSGADIEIFVSNKDLDIEYVRAHECVYFMLKLEKVKCTAAEATLAYNAARTAAATAGQGFQQQIEAAAAAAAKKCGMCFYKACAAKAGDPIPGSGTLVP